MVIEGKGDDATVLPNAQGRQYRLTDDTLHSDARTDRRSAQKMLGDLPTVKEIRSCLEQLAEERKALLDLLKVASKRDKALGKTEG